MSEGKKRMKRTPREKKRLELERDTIDRTSRPKLFRKSWPRKKARAKRTHRHKVKRTLESIAWDDPLATVAAIPVQRVQKRAAVWSLARAIAYKKRRREGRAGVGQLRKALTQIAEQSGLPYTVSTGSHNGAPTHLYVTIETDAGPVSIGFDEVRKPR